MKRDIPVCVEATKSSGGKLNFSEAVVGHVGSRTSNDAGEADADAETLFAGSCLLPTSGRASTSDAPNFATSKRTLEAMKRRNRLWRTIDEILMRVAGHRYSLLARETPETGNVKAAYTLKPTSPPGGKAMTAQEATRNAMFAYATHLNILFKQLDKVDVSAIADTVTDRWYNQTLCQVNGSVVRLGVMQGEYHWHKHDDDDEFFFCLDGEFLLDLEDRTVTLAPRQGFVVPKGVVHRTRAPQKCVILMVENAGIVPTGD